MLLSLQSDNQNKENVQVQKLSISYLILMLLLKRPSVDIQEKQYDYLWMSYNKQSWMGIELTMGGRLWQVRSIE